MPRNKYPEETVQKILDVSLKLFLERGYEQTSVLDIVEQLGGLTRGAFYHHFKSKEEVLDALGTQMFYSKSPFEKVRHEDGLNGLEKIKLAMKMQYHDEDYMNINIASISLMKNPRFLVEQIENNQTISSSILKEFIEEGIADGSIAAMNAQLLSEFVMLLTNFWTIPSIYPCSKQVLYEKIEFIKSILDEIGFPVFDEELMESIKKMVHQLDLE